MSRKANRRPAVRLQAQAHAFAALGDETRLALVVKLADGRAHSISKLTRGTQLTRQAITKHLRVLEGAGMVHCARAGRESLFEFNPQVVIGLKEYIDLVSGEWDRALGRLKDLVER
ncbi:MAG: helix-turn-helix domain-containing protein [Terriglobales bacterium]